MEGVMENVGGLMQNIRRRHMSITEMTEESVRLGVAQMDTGFKKIKEMSIMVLETGLRLPGLLFIELLWRYQGFSFEDISDDMMKQTPLSYFDIPTMLDFVHRRNFDHHAAIILSYFVIFISLMFLTLPLSRLIRMYSHFLSVFLFGVAYKLSAIYVDLEMKTGEEELKLDGLIKLERHGFHFLAQMLLVVLQSMLLEVDGEPWRVALPVFALPIVARMCGCPMDKLKNAHNYACTGTMIFIATYMLYRAPSLIKSTKTALRQIKAVFMVHGLADGVAVLWRKLRILELLTFTWITMFLMVLYVELIDKGRTWSEVGRILLTGVAETTNTPITLAALAVSVSYVCKWIADLTKLITGGTRSHGHVLAHSGYTEAVSVVILCIQTGFLGMQVEQKTILLALVLYIVISALLQSLFEIIEVVLLNLPSSPTASRARHARCICIALLLVVIPFFTTKTMLALLPIDIYTAIIIANSATVTARAIGVILKYIVLIVETKSEEPWEGIDDLTYYIDCANKGIELLAAKVVMVFGCMQVVKVGFSFATFAILLFHVIVNIYKRLEHTVSFIKNRNAAVKNINRLSKADVVQLREREDVCAICFIEMKEEARITPCKHYFHGPCLRKWLAVKMVCPLCYTYMKEDDFDSKSSSSGTLNEVQQNEEGAAVEENPENPEEQPEAPNAERAPGDMFDWDDLFGFRAERETRNRNEQRIHGARDMWPLLVDNDAYESDSDAGSEELVIEEENNN
ncbi:RING finger protein 145 homolog [Caenorhabditis elegans]|uniref:RING finger protein 145 homolog n=1 Tax=Caenorhabditis elegans TaxID=6239 RepID=RN145_CAEEL|nr:RING finger protein 145 homolog [Caenorhabditis elegans]Q95Y82.2 RecName: Full=RING finger protein 145 homolog [Caenorhabditis elegans]CCD68302.2 RING finger protein 145 homolog [Caenorhabditis elegans]|eukprot:NP_491382.2 RiNg Finger protein [Caenorhabditis elegans]